MEDYPQRYKITEIYPHLWFISENILVSAPLQPILPRKPPHNTRKTPHNKGRELKPPPFYEPRRLEWNLTQPKRQRADEQKR